jgi:hypothetical protein
MIGARASPRCELCRREKRHGQEAIEHLPEETVAHIQSAGCKAPRKNIIGAHNRCWKYLLCAITKHGEAKRDFEFIGEDKDRQLESLWRETKIGDVLPSENIEEESLQARAEMLQKKVTTMESSKMTKRWSGMKRTSTTMSFLGEGDLTPSWSIGPARSFLCWNSSVIGSKTRLQGAGRISSNGPTRHSHQKPRKSGRRRRR